jgi:alpha-L-arabinofuranosidase
MTKKIARKPSWNWIAIAAAATAAFLPPPAPAQTAAPATVTIQADAPGTKISPDLFGIFFEDINYAADGGLYAELVQNRSFEYSAADHNGWNSLTSWELVTRGGGKGAVKVETADPLNAENPHYAVVTVEDGGSGVGLMNSGFDGIPLKSGELYDVSFFARQTAGQPALLDVRLESRSGLLYGEAKFSGLTKDWAKYTATIQGAEDADARLVILISGAGTFCLDTVSLFPQKTFHNRPNGMRADLAQVIADLHPKFVRFPGGCLAHGYGLGNIYRWKNTIGPIEQRKEQFNIWHYHQSVGLGYFEYFQFCEDIGARPLPVLAAGVCCQNSPGGQHGIPMDQMQDYVQDILDLVEYANGPADSAWGARRAASGHPAPFHLEYLGVGNEDAQTPEFGVRFKMIYDAVKAKHPDITVVGTVGPSPSGSDFNEGWKFANDLGVDIVDEHYYQKPDWFLSNMERYDSYNRAGTKVYVGEYASWGNSLFNALAEAAYMTSLERNGDVVRMASYAPLLGREHHMQWHPNLIYFDNTRVSPSVNYYAQQLFSLNQGDVYLPTTVSSASSGSHRSGFLLGTWDTQAQFAGVKVTSGSKTLLDEPFAGDANNWTPESGQWSVSQGVYVQSADGQPAISRLATVIDQPNYELTLRARKTGGQEGFLIGFGATAADSYYWWNIGGWGNSQHAVEKTSEGTKGLVGTPAPGTIEMNRWYDIKIKVAGPQIKCYLDGVLIHQMRGVDNAGKPGLAASCVKDAKTGDVIIKLVNATATAMQPQVNLPGLGRINPAAAKTVLTGNPKGEDSFENPRNILPQTSEFTAGESFVCDAPAYSFTVIRMKTR